MEQSDPARYKWVVCGVVGLLSTRLLAVEAAAAVAATKSSMELDMVRLIMPLEGGRIECAILTTTATVECCFLTVGLVAVVLAEDKVDGDWVIVIDEGVGVKVGLSACCGDSPCKSWRRTALEWLRGPSRWLLAFDAPRLTWDDGDADEDDDDDELGVVVVVVVVWPMLVDAAWDAVLFGPLWLLLLLLLIVEGSGDGLFILSSSVRIRIDSSSFDF